MPFGTVKRNYLRFKRFGFFTYCIYVYRCIIRYRIKDFNTFQLFFDSKIGLELGGPSGAFTEKGFAPVYPIAKQIDNCNFSSQTLWEGTIRKENGFVFNPQKAPGNQYIAEAGELHFLQDASYDFVISSHCIEHLANPLKGLSEWKRVLKTDGFLLLVVPHKDGTFDHLRSVTTLEHLIRDFQQNTPESDLTHLDEILQCHDYAEEEMSQKDFRERGQRNLESRCLHHHVFDVRASIDMVNVAGFQIHKVESFMPFHIVILAQKKPDQTPIDNAPFRENAQNKFWKSPFPSDNRVPT